MDEEYMDVGIYEPTYVFSTVDGYKDRPVVGEKIARKLEARIDRVEPIGVKSPVGLEVPDEPSSEIVELPRLFQVLPLRLFEIVAIDEILAGIVRRVDIDRGDLAHIRFPQNFERVEIVPFDVDVFRVDRADRAVASDASLANESQRLVGGNRRRSVFPAG